MSKSQTPRNIFFLPFGLFMFMTPTFCDLGTSFGLDIKEFSLGDEIFHALEK